VSDPSGSYEVSQLFAPRLSTLDGKTICEVASYYHRSEETFAVITPLLKKMYPTAKIIPYTNFTSIYMGGSDADRTSIGDQVKKAGCDAVIVGNGG
jgi:hypothetical protein